MKSKILLILIIFFIFVSSCARFSASDAYLYIPELYHKSGVEAYDNGNIKAALHLAKAACDNYSYDDCNLLGKLYLEGRYLDKDYNKAASYFNKGCIGKNGYSCLYMGDMYNTGFGVRQSDKKRDEYYKQAFDIFFQECNDNISQGCRGLGESYLLGYLEDPYEEGVNYLKKACNKKDDKSCLILADYYFYKADNKSEAFTYYNAACTNHNSQGCMKLLDMYNRDKSKNIKETSPIMSKADKMCKSGASNLCFYLGDMYRNYSRISKINSEKSFDYIRYSCEFNHPYGCKVLGDMYSTGFGVEENDGSAKSYYYKACQLGFSAACNNQ